MFPSQYISTEMLFCKPVNSMDLGDLGKGRFTINRIINIDTLQPRQTHVFGDTLNFKMKGKGLTVPYVVITDNGNILIDGHHTVLAKKLKGQKSVKAKCYIFKETK